MPRMFDATRTARPLGISRWRQLRAWVGHLSEVDFFLYTLPFCVWTIACVIGLVQGFRTMETMILFGNETFEFAFAEQPWHFSAAMLFNLAGIYLAVYLWHVLRRR